jgi:hypothetical protein
MMMKTATAAIRTASAANGKSASIAKTSANLSRPVAWRGAVSPKPRRERASHPCRSFAAFAFFDRDAMKPRVNASTFS